MIIPIAGVGIFLLSCGHRLLKSNRVEARATRSLQGLFQDRLFLGFFREIWFFGRTSFTIVVLLLLTGLDWSAGLVGLVIFTLAAVLEMLIKRSFKRQRPFREWDDIQMLQPFEPRDASFPSGDALRIWYLALILGTYTGNILPFWVGLITLAMLVSLGRVVLGVHYLSDVLGGIGLAGIAAGATIWLWNILGIL